MNISFEIENLTAKEADDLSIILFGVILDEDYLVTDYEITE